MNQVLRIFWKDVRHYWREAVLSSALVAAYGWKEVLDWQAGEVAIGIGGFLSPALLASFVARLLPIAWAFLIIRVIHGESLVGDRQFWVTRPYQWPKLLAAKVLFILAFVNLPLFVLDICLLAKAGFHPSRYVVGLLWMQLLISVFVFLPLAVLATLTSTIVQVFLALLVVVLYFVGMMWVGNSIPNADFGSDGIGWLVFLMFLVVCVAVIWLQYARRKTNRSRALFAELAAVLLLITVATPYRSLIAREFPQLSAGQTRPFELALQPAEKPAFDTSDDPQQKEVEFTLPLSVSGLDADKIVSLNGYVVDLVSSNGSHWNSGWKPDGSPIYPEQKTTWVRFNFKRDLFEAMKSSAITLRISLGFTVFRDTKAKQFITPSGVFTMKDVGQCVTNERFMRRVHCLAPLRRPRSLLITSDMSKSTCPLFPTEVPATEGELARGWIRGGEGLADFGISPIETVDLDVQPSNWTADRRIAAGICPGTPLVLSNPEPLGRNQISVEVERVRLSDYRVERPRFGGLSIRER